MALDTQTVETQIDGALLSTPRAVSAERASSGEVTVVPVSRVIEMYSVSAYELEQIGRASGSLTVHLIFFGIAFGASLAFLLSLLAQELSNRTFAIIWAMFVLTLAAAYFGTQASRSYRDAGQGVRIIRRESTRPTAG